MMVTKVKLYSEVYEDGLENQGKRLPLLGEAVERSETDEVDS